MAVSYLNEIRFSHLEDLRCLVVATPSFDTATPTSSFEDQVQAALAAARTYHLNDELALALDGYRQLQALILKTIDPQLPTGASRHASWRTLVTPELHDVLLSTTAATLTRSAVSLPALPAGVVNPDPVPVAVAQALAPFVAMGTSSAQSGVGVLVQQAAAAVQDQDWVSAKALYQQALSLPSGDDVLNGYLAHDAGLISVRAGDLSGGAAMLQKAADTFATAKIPDGQVASLSALADTLVRQGQTDKAADIGAAAVSIATTSGLGALSVAPTRSVGPTAFRQRRTLSAGAFAEPAIDDGAVTILPGLGSGPVAGQPIGAPPAHPAPGLPGHPVPPAGPPPRPAEGAGPLQGGTELLAMQYLDRTAKSQTLTVLSADAAPVAVALGADAAANLAGFYTTLQTTADLALVQIQRLPAPLLSAYVPYIYFFVLPMSIGDCLAAMGDAAGADTEYRAALQYRYLNPDFEAVKVWTRMAQNYLDQADSGYRAAADDTAAITAAAAGYAGIVEPDGSIPSGSPLYSSPAFAAITTRVQAVLAAADPTALDENPLLTRLVVTARLRQQQIAAGLNFFGFPPGYVPPFSFDYLQTTARYFAQHAATLEQSYIQFKSQAENEDFRLQQIQQQAELARASVDLAQRGVAEAQAGVAVAQAGVNYAAVQHANAVTAQTDFQNTRWELAELAGLEAWANAAAQDQDDEVHLTISGYSYYNVSDTRRSLVVQALESKRTLISQQNQADQLAGQVASAAAYGQVAATQLTQARSAVATAQQRVVVAQLQQKQAQDSQNFLDMKEFGARLWYELAATMRKLFEDYLDWAIQVAALMQRAYAAETGRDLRVIKFDYRNLATDNLLGSDTLLRDIDSFTLDRIVTTRTKKAPLKVTISMADGYPVAFAGLLASGSACFETTLEQFDRMYPGFYLHKVRNVELVLVGVSNGAGIHGTLRNIGVSSFRDATGAVQKLVYPADVMPLSDYDVRGDVVIFQPGGSELRLFENNGLATMWQIDLPLSANEVDLSALIDVQLVLSFDALFDPALEATVTASLPTSGTASKATSLRASAPDELFYLRQQGSGSIPLVPNDFPLTQKARSRTSATLQLTGPADLVGHLVLQVTPAGGSAITVTTDANGVAAGAAPADPLGALLGGDPATTLAITAAAAANAGKPARGQTVDLSALTDVRLLQEYAFNYR